MTPFNIHTSSVFDEFSNNGSSPKTYSERLQAFIDNPIPQINKFRKWKKRSLEGLSSDFIYKVGYADSLSIEGTVEKPELVKSKHNVSLLYHNPTHARIVWERTPDDCASIIQVDIPKHKQGNPYKLLPLLDKAFDIIFNQQKYSCIYARAGKPKNDTGVRSQLDWREDKITWRYQDHCRRPILLPRLMVLWLKLIKYSIPARFVSEDYPNEGILILSPNELRNCDESVLERFDAIHGQSKRKWSFKELIK